MPFQSRPCRECGEMVPLRIQRDVTRKFFCSQNCRARWYGKRNDLQPMWSKANTPEANAKKGRPGTSHPKWRPIGSKRITDHGYVEVKVGEDDWQYEHRFVAQALKGQIVHHLDKDKTNNNPANLQTMANTQHAALHGSMRTDFGRRWAEKFDACRGCGSTQRRHLALGYCTRCYQRKELRNVTDCFASPE